MLIPVGFGDAALWWCLRGAPDASVHSTRFPGIGESESCRAI